jgi:DNA modification methylase
MPVPRSTISVVTAGDPSSFTRPGESLNVYASGTRSRRSWLLIEGDCRQQLPLLRPGSIDCVVTSPPYYWQRDYQVDGQIGMEASIQGFVDNVVESMAGLHHALKPAGTVFLNLGDTYYNAKGRPHGADAKHKSRRMTVLRAVDGPGLGLPRKSLIGVPWRVALALQTAGWTLRSDVIWKRETSMPEPTAKDRPWRTYEHVFMFAKSPRYYFDRTALGAEEDVWLIEPERRSLARGTHYAPYPRDLVRRCLAIGCPPGGTVLDPFVGGGTTMSVALEMNHDAIGVELNPAFCQKIVTLLGVDDPGVT